jgi:predicted kinase
MLVHVTGVAGTGKSTLRVQLQAHGLVAVDSDDGLCAWFDSSGTQVPTLALGDRTHDWYEDHVWRLLPGKIEQLTLSCADGVGFLLGVFGDDAALRECFDARFFLTAPNDLIRARLKQRDGDGYDTRFLPYGGAAKWQETAETYWASVGYVPLNVARPVAEVADELLARVVR